MGTFFKVFFIVALTDRNDFGPSIGTRDVAVEGGRGGTAANFPAA